MNFIGLLILLGVCSATSTGYDTQKSQSVMKTSDNWVEVVDKDYWGYGNVLATVDQDAYDEKDVDSFIKELQTTEYQIKVLKHIKAYADILEALESEKASRTKYLQETSLDDVEEDDLWDKLDDALFELKNVYLQLTTEKTNFEYMGLGYLTVQNNGDPVVIKIEEIGNYEAAPAVSEDNSPINRQHCLLEDDLIEIVSKKRSVSVRLADVSCPPPPVEVLAQDNECTESDSKKKFQAFVKYGWFGKHSKTLHDVELSIPFGGIYTSGYLWVESHRYSIVSFKKVMKTKKGGRKQHRIVFKTLFGTKTHTISLKFETKWKRNEVFTFLGSSEL
jgi:hypothetical protein